MNNWFFFLGYLGRLFTLISGGSDNSIWAKPSDLSKLECFCRRITLYHDADATVHPNLITVRIFKLENKEALLCLFLKRLMKSFGAKFILLIQQKRNVNLLFNLLWELYNSWHLFKNFNQDKVDKAYNITARSLGKNSGTGLVQS